MISLEIQIVLGLIKRKAKLIKKPKMKKFIDNIRS